MSQTSVRTLPIRLPPLPDEALDSWLEALSARLHSPLGELAPALGLVVRHRAPGTRASQWLPNWTVVLRDDEAQGVAAACELDAAAVHRLTLMRFHQRGVLVKAETRAVHRHALWGRTLGSRFCPSCLADSGGRWQLAWRLGWSFACERHHCLLADACWNCQRSQRMHFLPHATLPVPGHCANPGLSTGRSAARCGADLTRTPVLELPAGHPVLLAQDRIARDIDTGTVPVGLYQGSPVAEFLGDVRLLGKLVLARSDLGVLEEHLPVGIVDAYRRARDIPHSKPAPSLSRDRPGFAAPGRAEIVAVAATIAVHALSLNDIAAAGTELAWLFAPKTGPGTPSAPGPIRSAAGASDLLLAVQREALHRPAMAAPRAAHPSPARTSQLPTLFWPTWTVALAPPQRHWRQTFHGLSHGLSVLAALLGSTDSVERASRDLGTHLPHHEVALLLHRLNALPSWTDIEQSMTVLVEYLDTEGSPIDYARRRALDYRDLLPEEVWTALSRGSHHFKDAPGRLRIARQWLFEHISGMNADQAPDAFALSDPFERARLSAFVVFLTPELLHGLEAHALEFLHRGGVTDEPLTWCPPTHLLADHDLPSNDLTHCRIEEIHHLIREERLSPRAVATRLGTTIDAVRCLLSTDPAPLSTTQQRAHGRLAWTLEQRLPPQELERLHHHERQTVTSIARHFNVPTRLVTSLLATYGIPYLPRQPRPINADWLRHEYLDNHRTIREIAAELDIAPAYLGRRAKAVGIPIRHGGVQLPPRPRSSAAQQRAVLAREMHASGTTVHQIAEELGRSPRTVYGYLHNTAGPATAPTPPTLRSS